jgi:dephospho-CoA kinase
LFVYEAALLYETGGEAYVDAVAVVVAPERERIERVRRRDGLDASQVRARMNHQGSPASARARADFVIENDGDLAHLRRQVEAVYQQLIQHEEARGASPPGPSAPTSPF